MAPKFVNQSAVDEEIDRWLAGKGLEGESPALAPPVAEAAPQHPLTAELLQPVVTFPFTAFSLLTKDPHTGKTPYEPFELSDKEASTLTQAWLHPLQRLLPASQSVDLVIAVTVTMGVLAEKYALFHKDKKLAAGAAEAATARPVAGSNGAEAAAAKP